MDTTRSDTDLIKAAKHGDSTAFSELAQRHYDPSVGYACSILGDFHLAQDAVQEAFLAAYRGLRALQNDDAFGGWLKSIVHHQCHRFLRRSDLEWAPLE